MPTQMEYLQDQLAQAESQLGKDAPFAKALRAQLAGMRSMEASREQNFLVGTREAPAPSPSPRADTSDPSGRLSAHEIELLRQDFKAKDELIKAELARAK